MRFFAFALALMTLVGCTEGLRGVPMRAPAQTGRPVVTVTTSEREGLVVLWNGVTSGDDFESKAWIAGAAEELAAVWRAAARGEPPFVDFSRYVVIAHAGGDDACQPKVLSLHAEASGLLTLEVEPPRASLPPNMPPCSYSTTRYARILAIPRRALTATVVFLDGYAFQVPDVPFG